MYSLFVSVVVAQVAYGLIMLAVFVSRIRGRALNLNTSIAGRAVLGILMACYAVMLIAYISGRFISPGREYWLGLSTDHDIRRAALVGATVSTCGMMALYAITVNDFHRLVRTRIWPPIFASLTMTATWSMIVCPLVAMSGVYPWKMYLDWLPLGIVVRVARIGLLLALAWNLRILACLLVDPKTWRALLRLLTDDHSDQPLPS